MFEDRVGTVFGTLVPQGERTSRTVTTLGDSHPDQGIPVVQDEAGPLRLSERVVRLKQKGDRRVG